MNKQPCGTTDVILGYRGGSGGFLLLHLLCLSEQYHVVWQNDQDFHQVFKKQWAILDKARWKDSETWPNNYATAVSQTCQHKIVFHCNPSLQTFVDDPLVDIVAAYRTIKDPSWPEIVNFREYSYLEQKIRHEFEIDHGMLPAINWCHRYYKARKLWLYTDVQSQETLCSYKRAYNYYNTHLGDAIKPIEADIWGCRQVDRHAIECMSNSDTTIYLQDLLTNPGLLVDLKLIDKITSCQTDFVRHWLDLHTDKVRKEMGLE